MACCLCFGSRTGRNMKLKDNSDKKSRRDESSSSAEPGRGLSGSETQQKSANRTQIFSYRELATATNNFKVDSLIGRGGFGAVYKGWIESEGQNIAVKMLDKSGIQGEKEFLVEVLMLSLLRHENLVTLFGYCAEGDQRLVVYEYMPLGSVDDHIYDLSDDQEALDWNTRIKIAAGAARGLEYLHNVADPPVIYRDLKTSNILLDHGYKPKLSDFGLAKFGPTGDMSHVSTRVMGTHGYCAPEYANSGKLTPKSDIYSFGVVMLELITGRKALMNSCDCVGPSRFLVNWAHSLYLKDEIKQIVDPTLLTKAGYSESTMRRALDVAFMCLREEASARPSISEVVIALNYIVKCTLRKQKKKTRVGLGRGGDFEKGSVSSPKETTRMLIVNEEEEEEIEELEREREVAEARSWAMNYGGVRRPSTEPTTSSPTKC